MQLVAKRDIPRLSGRSYKLGERVPTDALPQRALSNFLARGWIGMVDTDEGTPTLTGSVDTTTADPPPQTTSNTPVEIPADNSTKRSRGRPAGSTDKKPRRKRTKTKTSAKRGNNLR